MEGREMEVFEDLMEYTTIKSSDEISTKDDLRKFFDEVKTDAKKRPVKKDRKRIFTTTKRFFDSVWDMIIDLKQTERELKRGRDRRIK